jgi:hypothetical protein
MSLYCLGKNRYKTKLEAEKISKRMSQRKRQPGAKPHARRGIVEPYHCEHCNCWHLGRGK